MADMEHRDATTHVGYARVSRPHQSLALQLDALHEANVSKIFSEVASGVSEARPQLEACLEYLRPGDTLVVWRLDRLGRSLQHLVATVESLRERGIGFKSVCEDLNTGSPGGNLTFNLFCSLASFERELLIERTNSGLAAARAAGRVGGRPPALSAKGLDQAKRLYRSGDSVSDIARLLSVSRATIYRAIST